MKFPMKHLFNKTKFGGVNRNYLPTPGTDLETDGAQRRREDSLAIFRWQVDAIIPWINTQTQALWMVWSSILGFECNEGTTSPPRVHSSSPVVEGEV